MMLNDLYNSTVEINNFLSYIFTFESLYLIVTFGTLFFVFFIPAAYLIDHRLRAQSKIIQFVFFLLIGVVTAPVLSFMLHQEIKLELFPTIFMLIAFPLFGFLRIKLNG